MRRRGLGRGLDALLPSGGYDAEEAGGVREIPISQIRPNKLQPRQRFDPEKLTELAESIREHGVVQPVVVRPTDDGYELIVGERRWRASQQAGLTTIPAVVKEMGSDANVIEIALVENLQRQDLNPLEEASAYRYLIEEYKLTQDEVAQRVGRSRPQIANTLRLLSLGAEIQESIQAGALTMGHAKAVLSVTEPGAQRQLFRKIVDQGLSVRAAEELARRLVEGPRPQRAKKQGASPYAAVEERLRNTLGTKVAIKGQKGRGRVEIEFYSDEDLDRIVEIVSGGRDG